MRSTRWSIQCRSVAESSASASVLRRQTTSLPTSARRSTTSAEVSAETLVLTWAELNEHVEALALQIQALPADQRPDAILAISRGGLVPGAMLAYRLGIRDLLIAVAEHYDAAGRRPEPTIARMPSDESLKGRSILIVDEVWESGRTLALVAERARAAGATVRTAVVHHKPGKSEVPGAPDLFAALADGWITYPYKGGE
ncbi:MAG: phosphoribosyltransferase [Chloroflexi bacterium]|nr:MAG: phosphoribosyltransferase [Chloroflexota bacterium]